MKTNTEEEQPQLMYLVTDYEGEVVGLHSTLELAFDTYNDVLAHGLSTEDREMLLAEYGEDFHEEIDHPPTIIVREVDGFHVWSYDSVIEIKHALEEGEDYS